MGATQEPLGPVFSPQHGPTFPGVAAVSGQLGAGGRMHPLRWSCCQPGLKPVLHPAARGVEDDAVPWWPHVLGSLTVTRF